MNKLILSLAVCLIVSLGITGCQQNPYNAAAVPGQKIVVDNPNTAQQTPKVFSVEAPDMIECTESQSCGAEIHGHVPSPGDAIVEIKGLPTGATYDAVTGLFAYTPGFDVVNISAHPEQSMVLMPLTITVRSSTDPVTETSRSVTLIVKNKMQPVSINVTGSSSVKEGSTLEQTIEVQSADFPQGPFSLAAVNAPVGTQIEQVSGSANLFKVRFTPGYNFADVDDTQTVDVSYNVSLPIGQAMNKVVTWSVSDVRQSPNISGPDAITGGLDVSFLIRAEDLNGEAAPRINVNTTVPFGRITTNTITDSAGQGLSYPSKMIQVRWDQLKAGNLGTTTPISYEVCVQKYSGSFTLCTQKKVLISLKSIIHLAPKIDRTTWNAGDLKFLRAGTPMTFTMPISDTEDQSMPVDVKVTSNQPDAVTWNNGVLTVKPTVEGILQFTITAESIFAQTTTENFVVESFPSTLAKTVMFTGDSIQNESAELAKLISSVDFLSVKYQISPRSLALRESCVLTTEALNSDVIDENLQDSLYQNFQAILVSSPLAGKLKGKLQEYMKSFGVKILGRLSSVAPHADLSSMTLTIDSSSSLESPKIPAGLKGVLTSESKDPLVFDLDQLSSQCVPLFNLQKPAMSFAVGVRCKGAEGKTFTILGFELADVLLDKKDAPLLSKWMDQFLTGKGN